MLIIFVHPANSDPVDAIGDYAAHAVAQLRDEGNEVVLLRPRLGASLGPGLVKVLPKTGRVALFVQYNPFSWGRWGVAPGLVWTLLLVRLLRRNVRVVMTIHEAYVPMRNLRWMVIGAWQRAQVRLLLGLVHHAIATAGYLESELSRGWPRRSIGLVPVGSNLPDRRAWRQAARRDAGYEGQLVIGTFSGGHPSHLQGLVARAASAAAGASPIPIVMLLLGSGNLAPAVTPGIERVDAPGYQDEETLARSLSTVDIFLGPYDDGATIHRTTLMAALQHGVPVVTTATARTERMLREDDALAFAGPDDPEGFAAEVVELVVNSGLRDRRGAACRSLYERRFTWPVVCAELAKVAADDGTSPHGGNRAGPIGQSIR